MDYKCTTKTYILNPLNEKCSIDLLNLQSLGFYKNKLRNCMLKKIPKTNKGNFCIKIYSNKKIQINGIKKIDDINLVINEAGINYIINEEYIIECILSNWVFVINNKEINLEETLKILNENNIISYFQKGHALVIKSEYYRKKIKMLLHENNKIITDDNDTKFNTTILLFKSGKCIMSDSTDNINIKLINRIKNYLIYK